MVLRQPSLHLAFRDSLSMWGLGFTDSARLGDLRVTVSSCLKLWDYTLSSPCLAFYMGTENGTQSIPY